MYRNRAVVVSAAALVFLVSCNLGGRAEDEKNNSKPLVKVGSQVVTLGEFRASLKRLVPEADNEASEEELRELRKNLLSQLVDEAIILDEAAKRNISVNEAELSKEINVLKEASGDADFKAAIESRYDSFENWKAELSRKLLIKKTVDTVVGTKILVTETDARAYYNANRRDYEVPERVRARMIIVKSEKAAENAKKRLKNESFESVAAAVSVGIEARSGGDLGYFARGDMPPEFEAAIFALNVGGVSQVIKTEYGYHIFKLEEKAEGGNLKFEDVKGKITERLKRERAEDAYNTWMMELKKTVSIDVDMGLLQ
ncbi:MAG: peptidyl-prolyl cis-trans isomerase [Deltaproteobacteria bacterium]|nr:peptidyl-prolyl cis-trans isomerase [Deltaproteobacteria bacterium]